MQKAYRTIRKQGKANEQELASFLVKNGQGLLPMVDLIEQCQVACDQLIDMTGRAAIQAVLQLSAMEAAGGPQQQGKRRPGDVVFYGRQPGQVLLSDRKLEVQRPRLRTKGPRSQEVEVPAYTAMQNPAPMGQRMLDILMHGVSTRNYKQVIPQMAETAGVSRSAVSRAAIEASEAEVEALLSRRFDDLKLLVIYVDGLVFGDYTMIGVVGVDAEGHKHVLGIREGATENSTVITELLEDIVSRGVDPKRKMLFVIDGSKALRAAINAVFGAEQPVQRCHVPQVEQLELGHHAELLRPDVELAHERPRVHEHLVAEVHGPAGQRAAVGTGVEHGQPPLERVGDRAAGGELDDQVGRLAQRVHRVGQPGQVERRLRLAVPDVHVDHRRACLAAFLRGRHELVQGDGKRRHRRLVELRPGRGDGDHRGRRRRGGGPAAINGHRQTLTGRP